MDYDEQKKDEKLLVATSGRPGFPERILDEFPDLSVTDYLRYRLTGQLPEEIEAGLQVGARKFTEAGLKLKAARMPKPEAVLPEDFVAPASVEDVAKGVELLCAEAERLLKSDEVSLNEANRFITHLRLTAAAADCLGVYYDPDGTLKHVAERAESLLETNAGSTETRVVCCAISLCVNGVPDRAYHEFSAYEVNKIFLRELSYGRSDTMRAALSVPELTDSTFKSLNNILETESNPKVHATLFTEVLPGLKSLDQNSRDWYLLSDFRIGEYGSMLRSLIVKTAGLEPPIPEKALEEQTSFLIENVTEYLKKGHFVCHRNAEKILDGLKEIYVKRGVKPEDPEKVKDLVDLIIEHKIKDYPSSYPDVGNIKQHIFAILEAIQGEPASENIFKRTLPEKILKFMEDNLPESVYSLLTFKWLRTKDSQ